MTNDPRGAAMTSHKVRVKASLNIEALVDLLEHTEQDALDAIDEDTLLDYFGGSFDDMIRRLHRLDILEVTIVTGD